jgi:hypothetical protein
VINKDPKMKSFPADTSLLPPPSFGNILIVVIPQVLFEVVSTGEAVLPRAMASVQRTVKPNCIGDMPSGDMSFKVSLAGEGAVAGGSQAVVRFFFWCLVF